MSGRDRETRERLLRTAARLFADRGFKKVTVRDICRTARANVAAVNYHFGDKLGLYREVLQLAAEALRSTTEIAKQGAAGCPADPRRRPGTRSAGGLWATQPAPASPGRLGARIPSRRRAALS